MKWLASGTSNSTEPYNYTLAAEGTVSRSTFNDALRQLVKMGMVEKKEGITP